MRVGPVAGPPAFARPQRTAPVEAAATASTAPAEADGDEAAPARKGSDTPFTHALHQGNGQKNGIRKRFAAEIAAQQAAAGLGDLPEADASSGVTPVDGAEVPAPVLGDDLPLVADDLVDGETTLPPDGQGEGETIVIDGSNFGVDLAIPADVFDPLDELREAVEESTDGPVEELQELLAAEIAQRLEDEQELLDVAV